MIEARSSMQAIGDWLFRGSRVYRLAEPDRMLTTVKIHWDSQTSDVEDGAGSVFYDVSWDELEFWDLEGFHLADEPN